jgi:hypothetical protein
VSGLDSSDEWEEEEVTFVPISLGTAEASMPDFLKVNLLQLHAQRTCHNYAQLHAQCTKHNVVPVAEPYQVPAVTVVALPCYCLVNALAGSQQ